jgi:hypothetical protein
MDNYKKRGHHFAAELPENNPTSLMDMGSRAKWAYGPHTALVRNENGDAQGR